MRIVECLKLGANDYITKPANHEIALARIKTQLDLLSYYQDSLQKRELETLNAMIVTYNHEINNPLTVAIGNLRDDIKDMDNAKLKKSKDAMYRIAKIVRSIQDVTRSNLKFSSYSARSKIIDIKSSDP